MISACDSSNEGGGSVNGSSSVNGGGSVNGSGPLNGNNQLPDYSTYQTTDKLDFDTMKSGNKDLPFLTKEGVAKLLNDTDNSKMDATDIGENIMDIQPSFVAPFSVGVLKRDALTIALARHNAVRRLAGLNPVKHNEEWSNIAQKGAYVSALYQKTGHDRNTYPENKLPAGFPKQIYEDAMTAVFAANLVLRPDPALSIDRYMSEFQNPKLGHRLWALNHLLEEVGFGFSAGPANPTIIDKATNFGVAVMHMGNLNMPRAEYDKFDWDFVSWPPAGYFPANSEMFDRNLFADRKRWHCLLNPAKYRLFSGGNKQTKVTLQKIDSSGKVIEVGGVKQQATISNADINNGIYIATAQLVPHEMGSGTIPKDPLIWHESTLGTYEAGDRIKVTIEPVGDKSKPECHDNYNMLIKDECNTTVEYIVEFFDLNQYK